MMSDIETKEASALWWIDVCCDCPKSEWVAQFMADRIDALKAERDELRDENRKLRDAIKQDVILNHDHDCEIDNELLAIFDQTKHDIEADLVSADTVKENK